MVLKSYGFGFCFILAGLSDKEVLLDLGVFLVYLEEMWLLNNKNVDGDNLLPARSLELNILSLSLPCENLIFFKFPSPIICCGDGFVSMVDLRA